MVTGVSHALYKKFNREAEAEYYLAAALHWMNLDATSPSRAAPASSNAGAAPADSHAASVPQTPPTTDASSQHHPPCSVAQPGPFQARLPPQELTSS
jgi:hypothetical protein